MVVATRKLPFMTLVRGVPHLLVAGALCILGCRDASKHPRADSAATINPVRPLTGSTTSTGWDSAAGPVVVVPASRESANVAIVLPGLTDSALASVSRFQLDSLENMPLDLFNLHGLIGSSGLRVVSQSVDQTGCVKWPTGRLTNPAPGAWRIALEKRRATGIPLSALEEMKAADSARFVGSILGAVEYLRDGGDPVFRGIPFSVRKGYQLMISPSSVLVAEVVRKINEEANPREEHILVLAEQQAEDGTFRVAFQMRSAGAEEALETSEILAALKIAKSNHPAFVLTFDYEDGGKVGLLERGPGSTWRIVWKSAYAGC